MTAVTYVTFLLTRQYTNQSGYEPLNLENGLLQRQADFHPEFESPGYQIEHKINWKADACSRCIQS